MTNQQEISSTRRVKVFRIFALVAAVFALGTVMKTFVCAKFSDSCPCRATSEEAGSGCSSSEDE